MHNFWISCQVMADMVKFYNFLISINLYYCIWYKKLSTTSKYHWLHYDNYRGVSGRWAGWAIAHPVFGRIEGAAGRRQRCATLLLAHPVLASLLRPCNNNEDSINIHVKTFLFYHHSLACIDSCHVVLIKRKKKTTNKISLFISQNLLLTVTYLKVKKNKKLYKVSLKKWTHQ